MTSVKSGSLRAAAVGTLLTAFSVGALITYKASAALRTLTKAKASGTLAPKAEWIPTAHLSSAAKPFVGTINYFSWVLIALLFGVLLGALVRALIPQRWLVRTIAAPGSLGVVTAAIAGAPLMLCSCCAAPVFDGFYARTRKLGPALSLMFAAPGLNPAALTLTFLLFSPHIAWARLIISLVIVLGTSLAMGRLSPSGAELPACPIDEPEPTFRSISHSLLVSLRDVATRSLPAIILGALVSMLLIQHVTFSSFAHASPVVATLIIAAIATLVALPTFGEIPIALALQAAGAPPPAVLAVLVAGPIVNLPSLATLARAVSIKAAVATAVAVFSITVFGTLIA
jgi:uncharacterized membrane protein YraQ (UPF0718 family)